MGYNLVVSRLTQKFSRSSLVARFTERLGSTYNTDILGTQCKTATIQQFIERANGFHSLLVKHGQA